MKSETMICRDVFIALLCKIKTFSLRFLCFSVQIFLHPPQYCRLILFIFNRAIVKNFASHLILSA